VSTMTSRDDSRLLADMATLAPTAPPATEPDLSEAVSRSLQVIGNPRCLTLLVNDPQRQTDSRSVLELLADRIDPANLRILVATGSHQIPPDRRESFQAELTAGVAVGELAWHDCRADDLVSIGALWRGHPWLTEDTPLLAVGSVEPHYFAGYTGAHKTFTIGCASYEDIEANHANALSPACRPGKLSGNPVYRGATDMLAALERSRPAAAINLVQIARSPVAAFGGTVAGCLQAAAAVAGQIYVKRIAAPAGVLVLEATGPLAQSFYQADKAIKNNEWAVRDGGTIILQAPCPDGIGQGQFVELLARARTHQQAMEVMSARGYRLGDHKAVKLRYLTDQACRAVKVFLVSEGISDDQARLLGVTKVGSVKEAMSLAGSQPGDEGVYLIRDAANLTVLPGGAAAAIDTADGEH